MDSKTQSHFFVYNTYFGFGQLICSVALCWALFGGLLCNTLCNTVLAQPTTTQGAKTTWQPNPKATLDTTAMRLGEQVRLILSTELPDKTLTVVFPQITDTLTKSVEVVRVGKIDTIQPTKAGAAASLQQQIWITSFDSGQYVIPPFQFTLKNNSNPTPDSLLPTFATNPLYLEVMGVPVDTLTQQLKDIKQPYDAPFRFEEALPWLIGGLIVAILLAVAWYFWKKRKRKPAAAPPPPPAEPPHLIAKRALEALAEQKLWQNDKVKEYHTQLTDILRNYILLRFGVDAPDLTSAEILDIFSRRAGADIAPATVEHLREVLQLADLVKFAKGLPLPQENERSLELAFRFVEATQYVTPNVASISTNEPNAIDS